MNDRNTSFKVETLQRDTTSTMNQQLHNNNTVTNDNEKTYGTLSNFETVSDEDNAESTIATIDRYILLKQLGEGGYGAVYLATDTETNLEVAIKSLPLIMSNNPGVLQEIKDNFSLVSKLHHPNIANISHLHRVGQDSIQSRKLGITSGSYLLIMEYVKGDTIADWQRQFENKQVPFNKALNVCSQVAAALDFAHSKKIIHRDIKPANIIINSENEVKVLDFGIAAQIKSSMTRMSVDNRYLSGTPTHMAPEQWGGKRQGPNTDQYALATMFYELISGEIPFASALEVSSDAMRACVINDDPEPINGLEEIQWLSLSKALSKKPSDRYANCMEFISAISMQEIVCATNSNSQKEKGSAFRVANKNKIAAAKLIKTFVEEYNCPDKDAVHEKLTDEFNVLEACLRTKDFLGVSECLEDIKLWVNNALEEEQQCQMELQRDIEAQRIEQLFNTTFQRTLKEFISSTWSMIVKVFTIILITIGLLFFIMLFYTIITSGG